MKNKEISDLIAGGPIPLQAKGNAFTITAKDAAKLTKDAGKQLIIDTIRDAASQQKYTCELKELSEENEADLKQAGFIVTRGEGQAITVKWQP
jgi:hypothetical protein